MKCVPNETQVILLSPAAPDRVHHTRVPVQVEKGLSCSLQTLTILVVQAFQALDVNVKSKV